ncbi:armadillo repeat-containing protein 5 [Gouania willdenowi]|uniref:armadillo repeat-containing protein 5 n=1 Tax=Gouania willdenowi TaxID=441366 RepID=UPI00105519F5|nr:armadillo repeat-containing protein 5 [Gouania willdenowi]XP_028311517.1 armadillo repeat-containing protein 5 [Gouania willdenowi]
MAASPLQADRKPSKASSRDGGSSPESSLTWCLAHLSKAGGEPHGQLDSVGGNGRELDKRWRGSQWRALVAIRTQHIKGDKAGIATFRRRGGLQPLLELLKHTQCSRKTLDLALSILANCCTESDTRVEVRKLDGITIVVEILKRNVALETVQNRAARALGNLAIDPESSALIHSSGGVPPLLLCVSSAPPSPTETPPTESSPKLECAQSAARALLYLSDTPTNRLSLVTQGAVPALAPLMAPEFPVSLRRAALRALHELTRGCSVECAREVSRSGVLAQLGVMATGEAGKPLEELALKSLANLCSQGCLRPLVGSLGVIQRFTEEVKREPLKSGVFLRALCLCCKEAVNRAKVKESGGLEALVGFLSAHRSHPLSRLPLLACVDFVFDESAMEQLQELGLVAPLVARLVELTRGEEESEERMDLNSSSSISPSELMPTSCFDSFDFPTADAYKKEDVGKEQFSSSFLSLRSWLVSEGLISSEGDLLDSPNVEGEWASLQIPSTFPPLTSSPNSTSSSSSSSSRSAATPTSSPAPKKAAQYFPASKVLDPLFLETRPPVSPPTNATQTPPSLSKLSLSLRRKQRVNPVNSLTKVTLEAPPSATRLTTFHHPYHPEPWTPESPILLLLSRFSHSTDPSAALVSSGAVAALLHYLTQHQDPSSRCFRLLCRLSCNPNCLQALVRTGTVALIDHLLCHSRGDADAEGRERQTGRVKAKVQQLGVALLNNLRVQCESGFGSGVLAHVMLSGSETDKINCALSLPLITSNKCVLKKLLLDSRGLLLALQPLDCDDDDLDEEDRPSGCKRLPVEVLNSPRSPATPHLSGFYFSFLIGCLSALTFKHELKHKHVNANASAVKAVKVSPPPLKKARLDNSCPYSDATFDLSFSLDDGTRFAANKESVSRVEDSYFRALLKGGFDEAQGGRNDSVCIKAVSRGMILPALHYLHGCRLAAWTPDGEETPHKCQVLDSLVLETEEATFEETALGEAMIGACRFLVTELQRDLQDLCTSLLASCFSGRTAEESAEKTKAELESAAENLASRTSELELSGMARTREESPGRTKKLDSSPKLNRSQKLADGKSDTCVQTLQKSKTTNKSSVPGSVRSRIDPEETDSMPKTGSAVSLAGASSGLGFRAVLLPQLYWFSQRYSYSALRLNCLYLLFGTRECPRPFPSRAAAGDCLRRLARGSDGSETLKQDLLSLASAALC